METSEEFLVKITGAEYQDEELRIYGKLMLPTAPADGRIKLCAPKNRWVIEDSLELKENTFIYRIKVNDLFQIKETYSGRWAIAVDVFADGQLLDLPAALEFPGDFNVFIACGDNTANLLLAANSTGQAYLQIGNKPNIKELHSIRVRKNWFRLRFRTYDRVSDYLNRLNLKIRVKETNQEITPFYLRKLGSKVFAAYFRAENSEEIVKQIAREGITVLSAVDGQNYCSEIKDINLYTIYKSYWEEFQHSRKYTALGVLFYRFFFKWLPLKKKRVLFESFYGRNVSGNPKYIYLWMVENLDKDYELIWILNNPDQEIPGPAKKVKRRSLLYYYLMATSGYWVFNTRHPGNLLKRKGIKYLQTWHGTPYKRLGLDMFSAQMAGVKDADDYKQKFLKNSSQWDYLIAQNDYAAEIFKRAFAFEGEMLAYGYPANDILYNLNNEAAIKKLKQKFGLPLDKKVIMYAPTWREDNYFKKGHYKMSLELDLKKMKEVLGDEYVLILRLHYLVTSAVNLDELEGFAFDFSRGHDIQELYLVTDVLITDYSSAMFDYANLKRPIVFFAYDLERYTSALRGAYFDLEEWAPGPVVKTSDEVIGAILNLDNYQEQYGQKMDKFYQKFCHADDGRAAERVVKRVFLGEKSGGK